MTEEIDFEYRHFWNFTSHVTLTLTSDDLESHIIVNVSSTLTNSTIWFVAALCLWTYVRTYGRTYGRTDGRTFLPDLLGHLGGDDLKIGEVMRADRRTDMQHFEPLTRSEINIDFKGAIRNATRQSTFLWLTWRNAEKGALFPDFGEVVAIAIKQVGVPMLYA